MYWATSFCDREKSSNRDWMKAESDSGAVGGAAGAVRFMGATLFRRPPGAFLPATARRGPPGSRSGALAPMVAL